MISYFSVKTNNNNNNNNNNNSNCGCQNLSLCFGLKVPLFNNNASEEKKAWEKAL